MAGKKDTQTNTQPNTIVIELVNGERIEIKYSNSRTAQNLYTYHRAQAQYGGVWIKTIELV